MAKRRAKAGRSDVITLVQKKLGCSKLNAQKAVVAVFGAVSEGLKKHSEVQILGFGRFRVSKRAARTGHNPRTGKVLQIGETSTVRFKAGRTLKAGTKPE